ncbi:MAG TPA: hypothetical protein VFQ76_16810, partial [Longimicrobiaceae bacterium]|nr:hypothetical protein [Longimicrobiaceae bacterium]
DEEAVAMYNASALLIPYLPALAASSPMYDGELQDAVDNRLAWILEHQARIPESQGEIVPEYIDSLADYRKRILGGMYAALDRIPDTGPIRHEFFNARGAVFKASSKRMEVRVLDTQECVRMDMAVSTFVRSALKTRTQRVMEGRAPLPAHAVLVADFRATVRDGSRARVTAPHFGSVARDAEGRAEVRDVLRVLLEDARRSVRKDEADYLELAGRIVEAGTLSERIRAALLPFQEAEDEVFTDAARRIYIELMDCLEANEPWARRWGGAAPPPPRPRSSPWPRRGAPPAGPRRRRRCPGASWWSASTGACSRWSAAGAEPRPRSARGRGAAAGRCSWTGRAASSSP